MVLMRSYLFCSSVRLGVIIISTFALAKNILTVYVLAAYDIRVMLTIISAFDIDMSYRNSFYMVRDTMNWLKKYPQTVFIITQLFSATHLFSCILAAYGAYKLRKNFVIPLAFFEFFYMVEIITTFTLFLRILRHFVGLGTLILLTIAATAYAALVVYDFFVLVAFEQIVRLVRSKKYQEMYGSDPLNPVLNTIPCDWISSNTNGLRKMKTNHVVPLTGSKLWRDNSAEINIMDESLVVEKNRYFHSRELLPEVLLRNDIILGCNKKVRY